MGSLYSKEYMKHKAKVEAGLGFVPYRLDEILEIVAQYYMIYGERSNGKTYQVLEKCLYDAYHTGAQFAYIRRQEEDIKGRRGEMLLNAFEENHSIEAMTGGEWDGIKYYGRAWYWTRTEVINDRFVTTKSDNPIGFAFALSASQHDKGASYRGVKTIVFDEFISRPEDPYFPNEFVLFMNTLSTIIRDRNDVTIFMLGNTVNKYCPYFNEMGLTHAKELGAGQIEVYKYGDDTKKKKALRVAVEHTRPNAKGKLSDVYFAFDNPKLKMITSGEWEIAPYPRTPYKYKSTEILARCFLKWDREVMKIDLVEHEDDLFVNVSPRLMPIPDDAIVYTNEPNPSPRYRNKITQPVWPFEKLMLVLLQQDKWFYATNPTGELVANYLNYCGYTRR